MEQVISIKVDKEWIPVCKGKDRKQMMEVYKELKRCLKTVYKSFLIKIEPKGEIDE